MSNTRNPISCSIPFDQDGVHHGHLVLPWSRDDSAWGTLRIPVTIVRNGDGPTALVTGGNHGDEYEGPLVIVEWVQSVDLAEINGRVIAIPFMNYPAFMAAKRTSPVDGGNMNRLFPGMPNGTVSEKIADYFQCTLLPLADIVLDFHSGGRSLDFVPLAASHVLDDKKQEARCAAARDAFGAPWSLSMVEIDSAGMYDDAAEAMGKTFVTTELGGGGTSSPETVAIARRGLRNLLKHAGILAGQIEEHVSPRRLLQPGDNCFHFAPDLGMVELLVTLGDPVAEGDVLARIWPTGHTGQTPMNVLARMGGLLIGRHFPGLIQAGDCVAVLAIEGGA